MPYKEEPAAISGRPDEDDDELDPNDPYAEKEIFPAYTPAPASPPSAHLTPRRRALQKAARDRRLSTSASESPTSYTIFPDIEDYDPTYGLRPEGLPTHSGYEAFGRLWEKAREGEGRGLGGLMARHPVSGEVDEEDRGDVSDSWDEDEVGDIRSFDMVEMEESLRPIGRPSLSRAASGRRSVVGTNYEDDNAVEWETFPAVGGGVITRPRIYHSQSQIRAPSEAGRSIAMPSPSGTGSVTARASSIGGASSTIGVSVCQKLRILQILLTESELHDAVTRSTTIIGVESIPSIPSCCWTRSIQLAPVSHQSIRRIFRKPPSNPIRIIRQSSFSSIKQDSTFSRLSTFPQTIHECCFFRYTY